MAKTTKKKKPSQPGINSLVTANNQRVNQTPDTTALTNAQNSLAFLNNNPKVNTQFDPNIARQMQASGFPVPEEKIMKTKPGQFNAEQGGFKTESGQFYPTTNPDFKPQIETTKISFNKDGTIDYTPKGGEPIKLSKEEYNVLQGEAGNVTDKVKQIQETQQPQAPNIDLMTAEEIQAQSTGVDLTGGVVGGAIQGAAVAVEKLSSFLPEFLRFGTKKSLDVTKAEQGFADYSAVLDLQIEGFKQGTVTADTLERTFASAEQEIINLQAQTKNMGQIDLRFWLDRGAEIQAQIDREIAILQSKKARLGIQ